MKTTIQAALPPALLAKAEAYVQAGWSGSLDDLLAESLRRYLETHSADLQEQFVLDDIEWGLYGHR